MAPAAGGPQPVVAGSAPGDPDESTVKLAPHAPVRRHPRPSPRPRPLGAPRALGVVEGPASATTKAPAAHPGTPTPQPAAPAANPPSHPAAHPASGAPVVVAESVDPLPHEPTPRDDGQHDGHRANDRRDNGRHHAPHDLPALRQAAFGTPLTPRPGGTPAGPPPLVLDPVALPAAPALICDAAGRIVQVNAALLRLTGRTGTDLDGGLRGRHLSQLVAGPDTDARLVRADGALVRVRVVRWDMPDRDRQVVVFVELVDAYAAEIDRDAARRWTAELERLARVGTWSFDLATGVLHRSETLEELYRALGSTPTRSGGAVEGGQDALRAAWLRSGTPPADDRAELHLPGVRLSCRAEVEWTRTAPRAAHRRRPRHHGAARDEARAGTRPAASPTSWRWCPAGWRWSTRRAIARPTRRCARCWTSPAEQLRGMPSPRCPRSRRHRADRRSTAAGPLPSWLRPVPPGAQYGYRVDAAPLLRGRRHHRLVRAGRVGHHADDGSRQWLVVGHRRLRAAAGGRAAAPRRDGRRAHPPAQPRRLPRAARPAAGRAGPRARRRGVRRPRRLPAHQLLPRPRRGRRPARHAGRAAAARPARQLHGRRASPATSSW